jgi:hypothetical protein
MRKYLQGRFRPKNPQKYVGNVTDIIYRSSWELKAMMMFDNHPNVVEWSIEEFFIPYISPKDGKKHRYFIDFKIKVKNKDGKLETILIEVKPYTQTIQPEKKKKITKSYLNEIVTYSINQAKFDAAEGYCKNKGWKFQIFTEKELGIK